MTRYLIDAPAFLNNPTIYRALLDQEKDATAFCVWGGEGSGPTPTLIEANAYLRHHGDRVLTTPERAHIWQPTLDPQCNILVWCLELRGVPTAKARELAKKGASERSKLYHTLDAARDAAAQFNHPHQWQPTWTPIARDITAGPSREYRTITDGDELERLIRNIPPGAMVALDFETVGAYPFPDPVGFSFTHRPGYGYYVPLKHVGQENCTDANLVRWALFSITNNPWCAHNAQYEWQCLLNLGITPATLPHDTMVLAWLAGDTNEGRGLKGLAARLLGERMTTYEEVAGNRPIAEADIRQVTEYACADVDMSLRLWERYRTSQWAHHPVYTQIELPLIPILAGMERRGVRVDIPWLKEWEHELEATIAVEETVIRNYAGLDGLLLNVNSGRQLSWLLFEHLGLEPQRGLAQNGIYSTDDDTLRVLASRHDLPARILAFREAEKARGTYAVGLRESALVHGDSRLHGNYDSTGTKPGRMSSRSPNMQNLPLSSRRAILAGEGRQLVGADYAQIELRIMADQAQDSRLLDAFCRGISPHEGTLQAIFGLTDKKAHPREYVLAKSINFGIPYGAGADKLVLIARSGGVETTTAEMARNLAAHKRLYPFLWEWLAQQKRQIEALGFVDTLQGRRCTYPDAFSHDPGIRGAALREGTNALPQGTAGLITKEATVVMNSDYMALNEHDSLVGDVPEAEAADWGAWLQDTMVRTAKKYLDVPIEVEGAVGDCWKDLK